MSKVLFKRIVLIGVGLIGGSFCRAILQNNLASEIVGVDLDEDNLQDALRIKAITQVSTSIAQALKGADLVILATPVKTTRRVLAECAPYLESDALLTDVGSVKNTVVEDAYAVLGERAGRFIAGHPIAGGEQSGAAASNSDLFFNHKVILTPHALNTKKDLNRIAALWIGIGADVMYMDQVEHDKTLAVTSHLPHILAYALVDCLSSQVNRSQCFDLAAGGFYDFTRIASSNPIMWRDISLANSDALVAETRAFAQRMHDMADLIESQSGDELSAVFESARQARAQVGDRRKHNND